MSTESVPLVVEDVRSDPTKTDVTDRFETEIELACENNEASSMPLPITAVVVFEHEETPAPHMRVVIEMSEDVFGDDRIFGFGIDFDADEIDYDNDEHVVTDIDLFLTEFGELVRATRNEIWEIAAGFDDGER
jgi:hypothetical protein